MTLDEIFQEIGKLYIENIALKRELARRQADEEAKKEPETPVEEKDK